MLLCRAIIRRLHSCLWRRFQSLGHRGHQFLQTRHLSFEAGDLGMNAFHFGVDVVDLVIQLLHIELEACHFRGVRLVAPL